MNKQMTRDELFETALSRAFSLKKIPGWLESQFGAAMVKRNDVTIKFEPVYSTNKQPLKPHGVALLRLASDSGGVLRNQATADKLGVRRGVMNVESIKMVSRGLVDVHRDSGRASNLTITPDGLAYLDDVDK